MDRRTDLQERIRSGETYLSKLQANDPKFLPVRSKLARLKAELKQLDAEGAAVWTARPSDRTYDPEANRQASADMTNRATSHDTANTSLSPHFRPAYRIDPRPDLTEDQDLWTALLELVAEYDEELTALLNGFRCGGTRIRFGDTRWTLRPEIDPSGHAAWSSQAEYEGQRNKYLTEWSGVLSAVLDVLTERHPKQYKPKEPTHQQMRMKI
ncbi:hypothetical protein SAMN02799630_01204 [Paenibacillus sp. UNCCL117]|uniref:hypothetical protein n=1 Tax=unclassified Paenibacillus TaxID=185978 RepID=UPI00088BCE42|nr:MULTISPECIES: hypothetical protein [unclassified Paenibacillus]SDC69402.1 hypothetical protein SAMN04488602_103182 [Paenibacillus sp. cl123]SFW23916.1 hypothetical protein SAMN02799630_01204 [Paenibacillus sp. UNCCL117]